MSLTATAFQESCETLSSAWHALNCRTEWTECRCKQDARTKWLHIRLSKVSTVELTISAQDEIREDDESILDKQSSDWIDVMYDIVYSHTYQVPVLYLEARKQPSQAALSLQQLYDSVIEPEQASQLKTIGVMGAITLTDHPTRGVPVYMVHPCQTQGAMRDLCGGRDVSPLAYLMLWIGLIGVSVGLAMPTELAVSLQDASRGCS